MAMSGVEVDGNLINAFTEMKNKKSCAYLVMKLTEDNKRIVVVKEGEKLPPNCTQSRNEELFNEMVTQYVGNEPCYILFDFCFTRLNQTVAQKLVFISWCSDDYDHCSDAPVKKERKIKKMLHASSKGSLKSNFMGLNTPEYQCTDCSELNHFKIADDLRKRDRA